MRPSLLILAAVSYVTAQSCNPTFNVTSTSDCIKNCGLDAGKSIDPKFTLDSNSADFVNSLNLLCSKQNPDYLAFMTTAGKCWASCPKADQTGYTSTEFPATCQWFEAHKSDKCEGGASNNSTSNNNAANNTTQNKENASYRIQASGVVGLMAVGVAALLY